MCGSAVADVRGAVAWTSSWIGWPSVLVECTMQCYHGVAEREEKAGKLSHNTQSELFGTSADSVAMVVAAIYNTSSVIF